MRKPAQSRNCRRKPENPSMPGDARVRVSSCKSVMYTRKQSMLGSFFDSNAVYDAMQTLDIPNPQLLNATDVLQPFGKVLRQLQASLCHIELRIASAFDGRTRPVAAPASPNAGTRHPQHLTTDPWPPSSPSPSSKASRFR